MSFASWPSVDRLRFMNLREASMMSYIMDYNSLYAESFSRSLLLYERCFGHEAKVKDCITQNESSRISDKNKAFVLTLF